MRVVLDTNVLVWALLVEGSIPDQVTRLLIAGRCQWLVDARIVAEYRAVLERPIFRFSSAIVRDILGVVEKDAEWVIAHPLLLSLPDETDRPFIEVAVAGAADALVTGNTKDFRVREGRLAIPIVSPRKFLDLFAGS